MLWRKELQIKTSWNGCGKCNWRKTSYVCNRPKISILQAIEILVSSWEAVSAQTTVNCFWKAGITVEVQNAAITEVDNPLSDVKKSLRQLHDIDTDMIPDGVTSESLNVNNKVITTAPMITDDDILRSVTTNQQEQSDEDDENDEK